MPQASTSSSTPKPVLRVPRMSGLTGTGACALWGRCVMRKGSAISWWCPSALTFSSSTPEPNAARACLGTSASRGSAGRSITVGRTSTGMGSVAFARPGTCSSMGRARKR